MSSNETMTSDCLADQVEPGSWLLANDQSALKYFKHHGAGDSPGFFNILPVLPFVLMEQFDPAFKDSGKFWNISPQRRHSPLLG